MATKKTNTPEEHKADNISDFRFEQKRTYITPTGLAAQGVNEPAPKQKFFYDPHLPPSLRFDDTGDSYNLPGLLTKALREPLSKEQN